MIKRGQLENTNYFCDLVTAKIYLELSYKFLTKFSYNMQRIYIQENSILHLSGFTETALQFWRQIIKSLVGLC